MDKFLELLASGELWAAVVAVVIALNLFLVGLYGAIEKLDKLLPGDQSRFLAKLKAILDLLKKVIDMAGMNKAHEKKEIEK